MGTVKQNSDANSIDNNAAKARLREASHKQAALLENVSGRLDTLATSVAENTETAEQGVKLANEVATLCIDGNTSIAQFQVSLELLGSLEKRLAQVQERMAEVEKECMAIDDLAAQSHLLAVNATIEAAHLGSGGATFRVVADSIREMAKSSHNAAEIIHDIISQGTNDLEEVRAVARDVHESNNMSGQRCLNVFAEITSGVENIQLSMSESMRVARQQEEDTRNMSAGLRQHAEDNSRASSEIIGLITGNSIVDLTPAECHTHMHHYTIIDVRRAEEFVGELGHLENSNLLTIDDQFTTKLQEMDKDQPYLFT